MHLMMALSKPIIKNTDSQGIVMHAYNPSTREAEVEG